MNIPAKLDKHNGRPELLKSSQHRVKGVGCSVASSVTTRYYKGLSAGCDNLVIVVKHENRTIR